MNHAIVAIGENRRRSLKYCYPLTRIFSVCLRPGLQLWALPIVKATALKLLRELYNAITHPSICENTPKLKGCRRHLVSAREREMFNKNWSAAPGCVYGWIRAVAVGLGHSSNSWQPGLRSVSRVSDLSISRVTTGDNSCRGTTNSHQPTKSH